MQNRLEDLTVGKFDELDKNQSEISLQIIDSIHQKGGGEFKDYHLKKDMASL